MDVAAIGNFHDLKWAMILASILRYPNFSKQFIVKSDACLVGNRVVLLQEKHPIPYYSYKISGRMVGASIYAKEMYAIT